MSAESDAIRGQAAHLIRESAARLIRQGVAQAFAAAIASGGQQAIDFAAAFNEDESSYRQQLFERLGANAQRSMLASYDQLVTRQEGPASKTHYRAGNGRLAGGVLRDALAGKGFYVATADGLEFGNVAYLDAAAAQWHRINFGASGRGSGSDAEFPVRFGATAGTALGLDEGPSPGFSMPAGVWVGPEGARVAAGSSARGADLFYPQSDGGKSGSIGPALGRSALKSKVSGRPTGLRPTAGIEAKNFMDAGIRRIANDLPDAYQAYFEDLYQGAIKKGRQSKRLSIDVVQGRTSGAITKLNLP